jgi:hypothetical protein
VTHPLLYIVVAAVVSALAWIPGNWLLWFLWAQFAKHEGISEETPSPLVRKAGGLERIIYIIGVVGHHYELITGWLVLKAFFLFLERDVVGSPPRIAGLSRLEGKKLLGRYNGMLIGNALSLIFGVGLGVLANLVIRWRLGAQLEWGFG